MVRLSQKQGGGGGGGGGVEQGFQFYSHTQIAFMHGLTFISTYAKLLT